MCVCWEHHTSGRNRSRRFLKQLDDSFFGTELRELTQRGAFRDLLLVLREVLVGEVVNGDHLGPSNHSANKSKISVVLSAPILLPKWTRLVWLENQHAVSMASCYPKTCSFPWCARSQSPTEWKYMIFFSVLHRKECWMANPQSQHQDYQLFSLFAYIKKLIMWFSNSLIFYLLLFKRFPMYFTKIFLFAQSSSSLEWVGFLDG